MIDMQRDSPLILWDVNQTLKSDAPVTIIWCGKISGDSEDNDVIIAREDGSWEVYSYTKGDHPYLKYQINFQETIVGVSIGNVSRTDYKEIMVSLFSGKISGLVDSNAEPIVVNTDKERKAKIEQLAKEKENLLKKKAKNQAVIAEKTGDEGIVGFKAQFKFTLLPKEAAYQLIIESQFNMSVLLLQSTIIIDLLDEDIIPGQVSFSAADPTNNTNQFLVTIKLNESWNRIVLKIRTSEGLYGSLNAYIIPVEESSKICKRVDIPILPLSLHEKVAEIPNKDDLELSTITLTGNFSQNDILNYISKWLPNVPKIQEEDVMTLYFRSTFIGTFLIVSLANQTWTISSNNLSALTILKGRITSEATQKSKKIDISSKIIDESIEINLSLVHPKLEEQYKLAKNVQLIEGLKELQMQEEDLAFLSEEYKEILANSESIKEQFKLQPRKLNFLWGIIADLYNDTAVIKGVHEITSKMPKLKQILNNYNFDELVHFFKTSI